MRSVSRLLLVSSGTLCVILGVAGIFLPVLPTTPFLLLGAFCYSRSSPRFYDWLLNNRWFGSYIKNYREGRGIPLREKIFTLVALWVTIGFTSIAVISPWWGKLILAGIAAAVTVHVLRLKTYRGHGTIRHPDFAEASQEKGSPERAPSLAGHSLIGMFRSRRLR